MDARPWNNFPTRIGSSCFGQYGNSVSLSRRWVAPLLQTARHPPCLEEQILRSYLPDIKVKTPDYLS